MKNRWRWLPVLGVLLLGLVIRANNLDKSPASVNWDEASLGVNTYTILKTGRDEWGRILPLSLKSFGDYKPALYAYLSLPFVKWWGLNQSSIRMASAVWGTFSLLGLWLWLGIFVKKYWLRWWCLLIVSFQPWSIHYSRVALETNISAVIFLFGTYFLYLSWKNKKQILGNKIVAIILLALSAYGYHSARLAAPLLMLLVMMDPIGLIFKKSNLSEGIKKNWWCVLVVIGLIYPIFFEANSQEVLTRFRQENIFTRYYPYAPKELFGGSGLDWIRMNPAYYLGGLISGHISAYFSLVNYSTNVFHWIRRSVQYVPEFNIFGWIDIFLLIIGLLFLVKRFGISRYRFLVYWILAALAPAVVTWNWFHSLRALNGFAAIEILIVIGMIEMWKYFSQVRIGNLIKCVVVIMFLWQWVWVVNNELNYSVSENLGEFQAGGFKQGAPILKELENKYDKLIIDSPQAQSYVFFLFYQARDPGEILSWVKLRNQSETNGTWNFNFGKFEFRRINWDEDILKHKTVLWLPAIKNRDEIEKLVNAKVVYLASPTKKYNDAMIVTLD